MKVKKKWNPIIVHRFLDGSMMTNEQFTSWANTHVLPNNATRIIAQSLMEKMKNGEKTA